MSGPPVPVNVEILDKEYVVSCPEEERDALLASAKQLNDRMRQVRDSGKVLGTERMAVITALNIMHELNQQAREQEDSGRILGDEIRRLTEKARLAAPRRPVDGPDSTE